MKTFAPLSLVLIAACASVPHDGGVSEVQQAVAARNGPAVEWRSEPGEGTAVLDGELTPDQAVSIAMANNPRLQVALAELGVARADLIEASTISNPVFEFELRFPGEPYRPYELRLAQSVIELIQLPRRRALGRAAFEAAQTAADIAIRQHRAGNITEGVSSAPGGSSMNASEIPAVSDSG